MSRNLRPLLPAPGAAGSIVRPPGGAEDEQPQMSRARVINACDFCRLKKIKACRTPKREMALT